MLSGTGGGMSQSKLPRKDELHSVNETIKLANLSWAAFDGFYRANLDLSTVFGRDDIKDVQIITWSVLCWPIMDSYGTKVTLICPTNSFISTSSIVLRGFY